MSFNLEQPDGGAAAPGQRALVTYRRLLQTYLDKSVVYPKSRWGACAFLLFLFCLRVYILQGYFLVAYALGIYLLQALIGFVSPAIDPEEDPDGGPVLPTGGDDEFRPFTRKLPEMKFWQASINMILICNIMTLFSVFDLPVFWPILLGYFILLCVITMKERLAHMIKYKYVPFSIGKTTYRDLTKVEAAGGGPSPKKDAK